MELKIKNIGKFREAQIKIDGITVIAGENNSGKSTIGRVLFCIFNSFFKIEGRIKEEREKTIKQILREMFIRLEKDMDYRYRRDMEDILESSFEALKKIDFKSYEIQQIEEKFWKEIKNAGSNFNENGYINLDFNKISYRNLDFNENRFTYSGFRLIDTNLFKKLKVSSEEIFKIILQRNIDSEFNGEINNLNYFEEEGIIDLKVSDFNSHIPLKSNNVLDVKNNRSLINEAIYIDNPFIIDDVGRKPSYISRILMRRSQSHVTHLKDKLLEKKTKNEETIDSIMKEAIVNEEIQDIFNKINSVCCGELSLSKTSELEYKENDLRINIKNISAGLKTFVILKTLLKNQSIEKGGVIILDEPEIHLHPSWQIIFAELIILLQKKFEIKILLTTHSPYFLRAVQIFSAKHEIAGKCKFYLSENENGNAILKDTTDCIENIYNKLADPLEKLEIVGNEIDE